MKKNLLYLLALVCSLTFFAACSSDDDDSDNKDNGNPPEEEAVITAPDVVGTYWGNLDISMIPDGSDQEIVIGDGIEKFITLSQVSNTEVKIELKEFELFINQQILKFGDIVVDKCEVKKGEGVSTFTGQQDLNRRRPGQSILTTARKEADKVEFLSGIFEGKSNGCPIGFIVWNENQHPNDYNNLKNVYRPSPYSNALAALMLNMALPRAA